MKEKALQILKTAKNMFLTKGYRGTNIQSIADELNISKGSIYLHFKSKEQILIAILQQMDTELIKKIWIISDDPKRDKNESLFQQLYVMMDFGAEQRQFNELYFENEIAFSDNMKAFAVNSRLQWQLTLQQILLDHFGHNIKPWALELSVITSGMLNEFSSYMLFEKIDIPIRPTIEKIIFYLTSMTSSLLSQKPLPFSELTVLHDKIDDTRINTEKRIALLLDQLHMATENASYVDAEEKDTILQTFAQIKLSLSSEQTNLVIVRGLLLGLGQDKTIDSLRKELAPLIGVKL